MKDRTRAHSSFSITLIWLSYKAQLISCPFLSLLTSQNCLNIALHVCLILLWLYRSISSSLVMLLLCSIWTLLWLVWCFGVAARLRQSTHANDEGCDYILLKRSFPFTSVLFPNLGNLHPKFMCSYSTSHAFTRGIQSSNFITTTKKYKHRKKT